MNQVIKRFFIITFSFVGIFFNVTLWAAQSLDKVVAVVNDSVITQSELDRQINVVHQQLAQSNTPVPPAEQLRKQVLQHLIDVDLQMQMAKQNNIVIDETKLDQAINQIAARNKFKLSEMRQKIEAQGMSYDEYRENIRKEMTLAQIQRQAVGASIKINEEQVTRFLKTASTGNDANSQYHLKNILISLPEAPSPQTIHETEQVALTLLKEIRAGEDFSKEAVAHSAGNTALKGGDLGWRRLGEMPEVFAKRVVSMKKGEVAGPIRTANGFHLLKLIDSRNGDGASIKLTREQAKQLVTAREFQQAVANWMQTVRAKAYVKVT